MRKFYITLALVAVGGAVVVGSSMSNGTAASEAVDLGAIGDDELIDLGRGYTYGDEDAPITIMEFADFQCPACREFAMGVKPQLDMAYIRSGQVKLIFHDFPLEMHPNAFLAARAARCAEDQGQFSAYHDGLFASQRDWSPRRDPQGSFHDLAVDLSLDEGRFRSCLQSDAHADVVTANKQLGQRLGVSSTPTLVVQLADGSIQRLGSFSFAAIQALVESGDGNE